MLGEGVQKKVANLAKEVEEQKAKMKEEAEARAAQPKEEVAEPLEGMATFKVRPHPQGSCLLQSYTHHRTTALQCNGGVGGIIVIPRRWAGGE